MKIPSTTMFLVSELYRITSILSINGTVVVFLSFVYKKWCRIIESW